MRTNWRYEITADELPALMTVEEFKTATGGALASTDAQISWALAAVSQVVRDFCGWHVAPVLECSFTGTGEGRFLKLPAMGVAAVSAVTVNGTALDASAFEWADAGLVRLRCGCFPRAWRAVTVDFTAGYTCAGALGAVVVQMASNALAAAPGVREEHAGQVGISYNQTASGVSGGVRLLETDKALLDPYRISEV